MLCRALTLVLLFLLPATLFGQVIVGDAVPPGDVEAAQATLERNKPKAIKLNPGEFEVIEPAKGITVPLLWVPATSKLYDTVVIPAGASHSHYGIRAGQKEKKLHRFLPVAYVRTLLIASEKSGGQTTITVVRNGEKPELPPVAIDSVDVTVGDPPKPPPPPPPNPIDPVDPNPPNPVDPTPPMPGTGLRVLIVTETRDLSKLPSAQVQAMTAKVVLDYLDSHCVKVDNQPEYRKFDKDTDVTKLPQDWQDAMNRVTNADQRHPDTKATSFPWILITNGKKGYEGPLPKDADALLAKLKEYGGQ